MLDKKEIGMIVKDKIFSFNFNVAARGMIAHDVWISVARKEHRFLLALDTGSYTNIISKRIFKQAFKIDPEKIGKKKNLTSATKKEIAYTIKSDWLQMGNVTKSNVFIDCKDFPENLSVDGVIGWSFFENLGLSFDFKNGYVSIEKILEL